MPQPKITVPSTVFDLKADPGAIEAAAAKWRTVAPHTETAATELHAAAGTVYDDPWTGATRNSYEGFEGRVRSGLTTVGGHCDAVAKTLTDIAALLTEKQHELDAIADEISRVAPSVWVGGEVTFQPADAVGTALAKDKIAEAKRLRTELDAALRGRKIAGGVDWAAVTGGIGAFSGPDTGTTGAVIRLPDGRYVVNVSGTVELEANGSGDTVIRMPYQDVVIPHGSSSLLLRGGHGADTIHLGEHNVPVTVLGGDGGDEIYGGSGEDVVYGGDGDDEVYGGKGRDHVYGGDGDDYIDGQDGHDVLSGGDGDDVVYGLDGNDRIDGGDGRDYLEGAAGDDSLDGGDGKDVVSGGRGDDHVRGGDGDDVLYTGHGRDRVDGGLGHDTAHYQKGQDTVSAETRKHVTLTDHSFIEYEEGASEEFKDRIEADLDMLAGSTTGTKMLAALSDELNGWDKLTVEEFDADKGSADIDDSKFYNTEVTMNINPEFRLDVKEDDSYEGEPQPLPPISVLYHEMAHGYDFHRGTIDFTPHTDPDHPDYRQEEPGEWVPTRNHERQATGVPIDDDGDEKTPSRIDPDHPIEYTENGLLRELGFDEHKQYGNSTTGG